MIQTTKDRLLAAIKTVILLEDYSGADCIFSQKYDISPVAMVYILKQLASDFNFTITDDFVDFVDSLENITFAQLETLLEQYSGKTI